MPEPLDAALAEVRELLLSPGLVRAVAAGRRRGATPRVPRVELRPVAVSAGRRVVLTERHERAPLTRTLTADELTEAVEELLAEPFGNWHVEHGGGTLQLRVTKRGEAQVHRAAPAAGPVAETRTPAHDPAAAHDRTKHHRLPPDDPLFDAVGANAAKRRQVDAFLGRLDDVVPDQPVDRPLRVVDLGCGNAYLTLAAHRWLSRRGDVRTVGVDVREDVIARNRELVDRIGETGLEFVVDAAGDWQPAEPPDVVLALHACDTATDEALAQAVRWGTAAVLAAPCCHKDLRRQVDARGAHAVSGASPDLRAMLRDGILRARLLDTVTDALRADLLRLHGYRTDAVELVDPEHTPRNTLLRAVRTDRAAPAGLADDVAATCQALGVRPVLADLLERVSTTSGTTAGTAGRGEAPSAD
jgi:SAM-dependent methyltransferase